MKRWGRWLGFGLLGVVALLVVAKVVVEIRDQADPVDVDALARDFEPSEEVSGPERLATGVWTYDATGSEYIDLLGGPLHEFPPEVAQSVTDTECGQSITVQLFEQRHDTLDLCWDDEGRLVFDRFETRHEFVGVADLTVTDECEPIAIWWPGMADDEPEEAEAACTANGDMSGEVPAVVTREVVGVEPVDVGGTEVDAVRVRLTSQVATPDDPTHGTYDSEFWVGVDDPVIVRRTLDARVDASTPLGTVGFEEEFDIVARSLEPTSG